MNLQSKLQHYRLNQDEFDQITQLLGREPQGVEWALFSALWSEHCSYKTSRIHLKKFFSTSSRVLQSFGENAGVIDLDHGEKIAFKMESHNHPSYIEPYQGAATGVGGILRDIFTMGARPIALGNYLCFGDPSADRMASLVDGVVRGIGGYGNCVGVPTVTGQTEFDASYNGNILVNAFALGYFGSQEKVVTSVAKGPGNYVVYVGAKTGKDGVHGASMASESFDEESESKKPTVQIGDPFFEKLLIESCLEVIQQDLVVAIQDMGAAGLTSSSFEMAAKGNVGFRIDLNQVPKRDASINAEEVLLSESQERMLLICEPGKIEKLKSVFEKWDLDAEVIGEVIKERKVQLFWGDNKLTEIDPFVLTENAPQYERPYTPWKSKNKVSQLRDIEFSSAEKFLMRIMQDVRGSSRNWIYDQYDQRVGAHTARDCQSDVAILRLPETGRSLGIVLGCRPHIMRMDAAVGGMDSLVYPALELAAKGLEPLAVTDCLNFGNPEKPELMSEFVASVENMSAACEQFKTPVISGNVSFYNETLDKNVTSTPSTGVVGLGPSPEFIPFSEFQGNANLFLLQTKLNLSSHGYAWELNSNESSEFMGEFPLQDSSELSLFLQEYVKQHRPLSTRVIGKFGRVYALAKMGLGGVGAQVVPAWSSQELFRENFYEVLIESSDSEISIPEKWKQSIEVDLIGKTGGSHLKIGTQLEVSIADLKQSYLNGWRHNFESLA